MLAKFQDPTVPQTRQNPRWPPFSVKICDILYKNNSIKKSYECISLIFLQCVSRVYAQMHVKLQDGCHIMSEYMIYNSKINDVIHLSSGQTYIDIKNKTQYLICHL